MNLVSTRNYVTWWGLLILTQFLPGSGIPVQAAQLELGLGAWQQNPRGSVSYTYNVLDLLENQVENIANDLLPIESTFLDRLHSRAHDLFHETFPNANPEDVVNSMFTRTDTLDFDDDALYDPVVRPVGRLKILISPFLNFSFMATPMEFKGTGDKDLVFTFLGVTFVSNQKFESQLRLTHYDLAYYVDIPEFSAGQTWKLHTEAGFNVRIVDFHTQISQDYTGLAASASYIVPLPMLYLAAQLKNKDAISIEAETRGLRYSGDYTYSLIGRVKVHIVGPLSLAAGYRHDYIKFDVHDIDSEGTFSGSFIETVLIFQ
jgi:hypothetical protein